MFFALPRGASGQRIADAVLLNRLSLQKPPNSRKRLPDQAAIGRYHDQQGQHTAGRNGETRAHLHPHHRDDAGDLRID